MELKLEKLIQNLEKIAQDRGLSEDNPVVVRLSHPAASMVSVIAVAQQEPHLLILPLNVTWINLNPTSPNFRRALRRQSKDDPNDGIHTHTYVVLETYEQVFVEQYYDLDDEQIITSGNVAGAATTTSLGLVRMATAPAVAGNPIAVGANDPRLTDARTPLAHTHPQAPAQALATSTTNVIINNSTAPSVGHVLVAVSSTEATWRALTSADIQ